MKKLLAMILILVTVFAVSVPTYAYTPTKSQEKNWAIVQHLCKGQTIKLIDGNKMKESKYWKLVEHRRGKPYILVEKVVSYSDGTDHGWYTTKEGNRYIIGYNKRVPKGKRVTSYIIWNPKTNYCDDVLYVVDNNRYR